MSRKKFLLAVLVFCSFSFFAGKSFSDLVDGSETERVNPYPFIDLSREYIDQKDFIVNLQPLRDRLRSIAANFDKDQITVYFESLNTGANISINNDTKILPASLPKLPLAMIAFRKVQDGEWKMDDLLVVMATDIDDKWGSLYKSDVGETYTIEKLVSHMLIDSDNTAYNILLRNVDNSDLDRLVDELGLEELFTMDGKVTSKEYSRIFRSLYISSYLKREYSQKIITLLTQSAHNDFLGKSIPSDIPFAHKIGQNIEEGVYADSGIVYLKNRPYLLTVILKLDESSGGRDRAVKTMNELSESAYKYILNYEK